MADAGTLTTRNLIDIGVFAALYFAVITVTGLISAAAPIFLIAGWIVSIPLNGIVIALFVSRVPKLGALTLLGLAFGAIMALSGYHWASIPLPAILGLLADLVITRGPRSTLATRIPIAYAIFSLVLVVPLLPIFLNADAYYADIAAQMGPGYADDMRTLFQPWVPAAWAACLLALGYLGGLLGVRVLRRHFSRSGLA